MSKKDYHVQHENTEEYNHKEHNGHDSNDKHKSYDHHNHHERMIKDFKRRFLVSLIVIIPILVLSPMIHQWTNI